MLIFLVALVFNRAHSTISSIVCTPDNPTTLSNGLSYYLAGKQYNFSVTVIDPDISGWAQLTDVRITIPNSTNIVIFINPSGTGSNLPVTVLSGNVNAVADVSGTYNNCTVTFKVTIRWDTPESAFGAKNIIGQATTTFPAINTKSDTKNVGYGVCASFRVLNFAQNGVAADGFINPWHDSFTITGIPVYNVPGATASDAVATIDPGEITDTLLYRSGVNTGINDSSPDSLSYPIPAQYFSSLALGNYTWQVYAQTSTSPGFEFSSNTLSITCDEVEVTTIEFINGGGINNPPLNYYYRSVTQPGTQVRITARMRNGLGPMVGNVTFILENITNGTDDATIVIAHGQTTGTATLANPNPLPAAGTTLSSTYRIQSITGGAYGGDTPPNGQSVFGRIQQPANPVIWWDNEDPPSSGTPFTPWIGFSATADSLTFNWQPLANAHPDRDFYSYKVYYKQTTETLYKIVDRNTSGYAALANPITGTVTITGLLPLTNYDFYITAIDIFGNEVLPADAIPPVALRTQGTLASTLRVQLTDGITTYDDDTFATFNQPNNRPVRKTNLRVKVFIISAYNLPDTVNILLRPYPGTDFTSGGVLQGTPGTDYYRITTIKTGSNEWTGYIQEHIPWMDLGNSVKFIIESILNGIPTYSDYNSETETPATANPDDQPFTVSIQTPTQFTPWPTRILNNVIDDNNPYAYPAYYLTDDAYVTITVYDIKGRPVAKILDSAFRKGGQNIKENGWPGVNKSNKKLGVGLYHIHIQAKRVSDGKIILNSFQKVVIKK